MNNRIRAAIVGTGGISKAHANAVKAESSRAELVAACDVDNEKLSKFAAEHHVEATYNDVATMLREAKPDIVHIATPPSLHCDLSIQCMRAGAWVYCEKPLCSGLVEMDRIMEAEEETGKYTASVFQWRFGSGAQHLKQLIDAGTLGRPLVGTCLTLWYRPLSYFQVPWRGKWATELGGPTMGHGIHAMDCFLWELGEWEEVKAMAVRIDRPIEVEDVSTALVRFRNGAVGTIANSLLSPRQETYLRFDFQEGTLEARGLYSFKNASWSFSRGEVAARDKESATNPWQPSSDIESNQAAQYKHILDDFEAGRRPITSGDGVRRTIEFLSSLYKSAFTDQTVTAGSIKPGDPFYDRVHGGQVLHGYGDDRG